MDCLIKFLKSNYEWMFSGIAVVLLPLIWNFFFKKKKDVKSDTSKGDINGHINGHNDFKGPVMVNSQNKDSVIGGPNSQVIGNNSNNNVQINK